MSKYQHRSFAADKYEAKQWLSHNAPTLETFAGCAAVPVRGNRLALASKHGALWLNHGDYVLRNAVGELRVVPASVFIATYMAL